MTSPFYHQTGAVHTDYYLDSDLTLGSFINVWGRKFQVCDCDDFTKDFYASKYGLGKNDLISYICIKPTSANMAKVSFFLHTKHYFGK